MLRSRCIRLLPLLFLITSSAAFCQSANAKAWQILDDGLHEKSADKRVRAIHALISLTGNPRAIGLAEGALKDEKPEVRVAAATTLGGMKAARSRAKLRDALNDKEADVVLASANSLNALGDPIAYEVFYQVLTGTAKTHGSLSDEAKRTLSEPGKVAKLGMEQGINFIPYAGAGYGALRMLLKDDASPIRGAAALKLAKDPDAKAGAALLTAASDKKATVRAAAVTALAIRNDAKTRSAVAEAMNDSNDTVRYSAAVAYINMATPRRAAAK